MTKLYFINITNKLNQHKDAINYFLVKLNSETEYFNLRLERILKSEVVIVAKDNNEIIGIGGLEKKYRIIRNYLLIKKEYQGRSLGKHFVDELLIAAKNNYNLIMAIIDEENIISLKLHRISGYKIAGKRDNLYYAFNPLNTKGLLFYYLIKIMFPALKIVDIFKI